MTRPAFSAALIADLKARVAAHNEMFPDKITLGQLKKIYERQYKGDAPGARAMRKVDEHIDGLAKAFNPAHHPRAKDGKFSAKESVLAELPAKESDHRRAQQQSAGYDALTSDIVPETRGEALGNVATGAIALGNGAIIGHMLTSRDPDSWARRFVVSTTAIKPALIARLAVGVPLHVVAHGLSLAEKKTGRSFKSASMKRMAGAAAIGAQNLTVAATTKAMNAGIDVARIPVKSFLNTLDNGGKKVPSFGSVIRYNKGVTFRSAPRIVAMGAHIAALGARGGAGRFAGKLAVTAIPTMAFYNLIHGSSFDPVKFGQEYDELNYRRVRKVLEMPELDELQKAMRSELRKSLGGAAEETLSGVARELQDKLYGRASGAAISALGSAVGSGAGALVGAGSSAGVQAVRNAMAEGNPYHDAHGRFTSKDNAENSVVDAAAGGAKIGAGLGALAGGGATLLQLRRFNRSIFHAAMDRLDQHVNDISDSIKTHPKYSVNEDVKDLFKDHQDTMQDLKAGRAAFIQGKIDADNKVAQMMRENADFGEGMAGAGPEFYKRAAHKALNSQLATMLTRAGNEDTKVRLSSTGEFGAIRNLPKGSNLHGKVMAAIDGADEKTFASMIEDLRPAVRNQAIALFEKRQTLDEDIEKAMATHQGQIRQASDALETATQQAKEARGAAIDAKSEVDGTVAGSPEREAATAKLDKAESAAKKAENAFSRSVETKSKLMSTAPEIPAIGMISAPTPIERVAALKELQDKARPRAEAAADAREKSAETKFKKNLGALKDQHTAELQLLHAREIGIAATLGRRSLGMSKIAGENANPLLKAKVEHDAARKVEEEAQKSLSGARGELDALKAKKASLPRTRTPSAENDAARSALDTQIAAATAKVDAANTAATAAAATRAEHDQVLQREAEAFKAKYDEYRADAETSAPSSFIPPSAINVIARDVVRAAKAGYDPVARYAIEPTAKHLSGVMSYLERKAQGIAGATERNLRPFVMSQVENPDTGEKEWAPDPARIALTVGGLATTGAIATAGEFLHHSAQYIHAKATGQKNAKAPTQLQVEVRRHATKFGEGSIILHAADSRNKGDRVVLFGQRYEEGKDEPITIAPGARLADVLNQHNGQGGQPGGGNRQQQDAGWLGGQKAQIDDAVSKLVAKKGTEQLNGGGTSLWVRRKDDSDHNGPAGAYLGAFKAKFLTGELDKGTARADALQALFSKQSSVLKPGQIYSLLTGYMPGGEKKGIGVFKANEEFGSQDKDEVKGAFSAAIGDLMKSSPNDATKDALRKSVLALGAAQRLQPDDLKPMFEKINGGRVQERDAGPAEAPTRIVTQAAPEPEKPPFKIDDDEIEAPSQRDIDQADGVAQEVAASFNLKSERQVERISRVVATFAGMVQRAYPDYSADQAARLSGIALMRMKGDADDRSHFIDLIRTENYHKLSESLDRVLSDHEYGKLKNHENEYLNKAAFLMTGARSDDLDELVKFVSVAAVGAGTAGGERSDLTPTGQTKIPKYHPLKDGGAAAADIAVATTANHVLNNYLPKVPKMGWTATPNIHGPGDVIAGIKAAPAAVRTAFAGGVGSAAKAGGGLLSTALKLGAKGLISGLAGQAIYNAVQGASGGDSYRQKTTPGGQLAMAGGNIAGQIGGEGAGETAGAIAGGAIGSVLGPAGTIGGAAIGSGIGALGGAAVGGALGEFLTHATLQHFNKYEPSAVKRVLGTRVHPPANESALTQTGDVAGSTVGNAVGGSAGAELLGTLGGVAGGLSASKQKQGTGLPRRPSAPSGAIP